MRTLILVLVLVLCGSTVSADTITEQRDQLLGSLETVGSILTSRELGSGSLLELHQMYSSTQIEELHVLVAYPIDMTDGGAADAEQVAALALSRAIESSVPQVKGGGMELDGHVLFKFWHDSKKPDLTPYLTKVFKAFGTATVTKAHVESAKAQTLKIMGTGALPLDLGIAGALHKTPRPYAVLAADERRKRVEALDLAAVTKMIDKFKGGYVRVTLKGGTPDLDAIAKIVRDGLVGWKLAAYSAPAVPARIKKSAVVRHTGQQESSLNFQVELEAANEAEAAALQILLHSRGPLRERLFARTDAAFGAVERSGMTITGKLTIAPLRGKPDAAVAAIRAELRALTRKPLSAKELLAVQREIFEAPGAFRDEERDPRPIATQLAANATAIRAFAALTPKHVLAAAKKLAAAPHAIVILSEK